MDADRNAGHVGQAYHEIPDLGGIEVMIDGAAATASEVRRTVTRLPRLVIQIKDFLAAVLTLFFVVVLLVILYILARRVRPRTCWVNRSAAFSAYMKRHMRDVEGHLFQMRQQLRDGSVEILFRVGHADLPALKCAQPADNRAGEPGSANRAPDPNAPQQQQASSSCVLADRGAKLLKLLDHLTSRGEQQFNADLTLYYKFYTTLQNLERPIYKFFAKRDILNAPRFNKKNPQTGDLMEVIDEAAVAKFKSDFMHPFDELRSLLGALSAELATWSGIYHQTWYDAALFDFLTGVHMLNLELNAYHAQITRSYETRKSLAMTLQFNVWTLYFVPYAAKTFTVRIPLIWERFPKTFTTQFDLFQSGWKYLRTLFITLPRKLASEATYSENFDQTSTASAGEEAGDAAGDAAADDGEVREGFGFIKGLLSIGEFFGTIIKVAVAIAATLAEFLNDPIKAIMWPVFLVISMILSMVLILVHTLLTILMVNYLLGFLWAWFMAFTVSVLLTVVEVMFVAVLALVFTVLWLLDLVTGGLVVRLLRCENAPDAWEKTPSAADANKATRYLGTLCCYPCASRFKPEGALCWRLKPYVPDFCPQQQIVHTFRTGAVLGAGAVDGGPLMFDGLRLKDDPALAAKPRAEKEKAVRSAFDVGRHYLGNCYSAFSRYDYVNRHVCFNIDRLPDATYSAATKARLRSLCGQAYCEFEYKQASFRTDSARYRSAAAADADCICQSLRPPPSQPTPPGPPPLPQPALTASAVFSRSLLLFLTALFVLAAAYALYATAATMFERRGERADAAGGGAAATTKTKTGFGQKAAHAADKLHSFITSPDAERRVSHAVQKHSQDLGQKLKSFVGDSKSGAVHRHAHGVGDEVQSYPADGAKTTGQQQDLQADKEPGAVHRVAHGLGDKVQSYVAEKAKSSDQKQADQERRVASQARQQGVSPEEAGAAAAARENRQREHRKPILSHGARRKLESFGRQVKHSVGDAADHVGEKLRSGFDEASDFLDTTGLSRI